MPGEHLERNVRSEVRQAGCDKWLLRSFAGLSLACSIYCGIQLVEGTNDKSPATAIAGIAGGAITTAAMACGQHQLSRIHQSLQEQASLQTTIPCHPAKLDKQG